MMAGALFNAIIALAAWIVAAIVFGTAMIWTALKIIDAGKVAAGRETDCFGRGGGSRVATGRKVTNAYRTIQTNQINSTSNSPVQDRTGGF